MRTYCKKADPTSLEYAVPAVWWAFKGKWRRQDYGALLSEYSGYTIDEIRIISMANETWKFADGLQKIAEEAIRRIKARNLKLAPVKYEWRRDPGSGKLRELGIEEVMHQLLDHIAVYCLMELFNAKIEPCQFASIRGRGPVRGAKYIRSWVKADNEKEWYCKQNGHRYSRSTEYFIQGDVRKCYPSLRKEVALDLLQHDISKNDTLLWLVDSLLDTHLKGFIIGSILSQFLCNYIMSFAIREVYKWTKTRRGKSVRLVIHQCWYMDDFILASPDARNLKMAYTKLGEYMKKRFQLELKPSPVIRWDEKPPDIMGYVIHCDGTITIRPRDYIKARRAFVRAGKQEMMLLAHARRVTSYKGYFVNSDCTVETKRLKVIEISKKAAKLISDFDTGRLMQCIPKSSSTAATRQLSANSSTRTEPQSTA